MYLYLGQETVVRTEDVVAVFDLENTSTSHLTRAYLANAQRSGNIIEVSEDLPRSFIICERGGASAVYLSHISPATLKKRLQDLAR